MIVVLGSLNIDLVVRGPHLPRPGETVLGGRFFQALGGKGANQAVAAARAAREPVQFVGAVGDDDLGRQALEQLAHENLVLSHLRQLPGSATGVALILVDHGGENMISVASGANALVSPDDIDALPDALFSDSRLFVACLELPPQTVLRALKRAKRAGLTTILNPAPVSPGMIDKKWPEWVDVVTPNAGEAAVLAGLSPELTNPEQIAQTLREQGWRNIVLTLGSAGCLVQAEAGEPVAIPACPVEAIDATAAGDAFTGALAVALSEGKPLVTAARWATAAAAISVSRLGAQPSLPRREEIEAMESAGEM